MPFLSGSLPTLHRAEVLQAEVVLAVHHDGPGGRQTELGSGAARGGRRLLRRRTFLFFLFLHLVIHQAMLDLEKREGVTYLFRKIGEVYNYEQFVSLFLYSTIGNMQSIRNPGVR